MIGWTVTFQVWSQIECVLCVCIICCTLYGVCSICAVTATNFLTVAVVDVYSDMKSSLGLCVAANLTPAK